MSAAADREARAVLGIVKCAVEHGETLGRNVRKEGEMNPLQELRQQGQSVWVDVISRDLLASGELKRLVEEDGVTGVTSNPTIFHKAISGSSEYDAPLRKMLEENARADVAALYEGLAIEDIQMATDVLRPVYDETGGADGFVSLEVSPLLAHDTEATLPEVRRLWGLVDRPNLMVKVPATKEGIPAIETLIGEGHNINITLMFSLDHYEAVASAYIRGLERAADPARVASVASFFVSRVDTKVDKALEKIGRPEALALRGKIAVANSKLAYRRFKEIFHGDAFAGLRERGARVQRPLWASTGTKNPEYSDVLYVETLIGRETVNTIPPATMDALRDHGKVRPTVEEGVEEAAADVARLAELGVDLDRITEELQEEGVKAFADSYEALLAAVEEKRAAVTGEGQ